jgi:hypothetical protein
VTTFITVRRIAWSRDFYSRVLGDTVVMEENPCVVKLANSWILMNPGGPPTPDTAGITVANYGRRKKTQWLSRSGGRHSLRRRTGVADVLGHVT